MYTFLKMDWIGTFLVLIFILNFKSVWPQQKTVRIGKFRNMLFTLLNITKCVKNSILYHQ